MAVGAFGREYARSRGANPWHSEAVRDEGIIILGKVGSNTWNVKFTDGEHRFERKALQLVRRAAAQRDRGAAVTREVDSESDAAEQLEEEQPVDSSDEEESPVGAADHEGAAGGRQVAGYTALTQWCRDDDYGMDERAKHGFNYQSGPRLNGAVRLGERVAVCTCEALPANELHW